jgi:hypothetical protein
VIDRRAFLSAAAAAGVGAALPGVAGARRARISKAPNGSLQSVMKGHVFTRGDPGFNTAKQVFNELFNWVTPHWVARPVSEADVQNAVKWCVQHNVVLRARSGGHSYEGYSTVPNGVMLDLRKMNGISVNKSQKTATIGAGAQLINIYNTLAQHGVTIPAGSCPSVGVSGVTLGGGMGLAARAFGMSCDNLMGAHVVTADGQLHHVNQQTDPNFLWALRGGGGGNFGVCTQFTFKVHPIPRHASYFFVNWPSSRASDAIEAWQGWAPHARDQLTSIFHINPGASVSVSGQYMGPASDLGSLLKPLTQSGGSVQSGNQSYFNLQMIFAGCFNKYTFTQCHTVNTWPGGEMSRQLFRAKSDYVSKALSSQARNFLISQARKPGAGAILFDSYGGAINRVHPTATAFVHRDQLFCIQYFNGSPSWLDQTKSGMRSHVSGQAYQNYIDRDQPHWQNAYYGKNYSRLESFRKTIDPHHFFNFPQAIGR